MNNLLEYLKTNFIKFEQVSENIVKIEEKTYQLVYPDKDGVLFDSLFQMTCDDTEEDNYVFEFGGKWYWTPKGTETNPQLNLLKYIGEANIEPPSLPWLGIHGKYEILNGSRDYKDWCKKAKFLKCDTLGICELNTLAGTMPFQMECDSFELKSIIGETFIVRNQKQDLHYRIKLYAKNEQGWQTLLKFNKSVNVDNNGFVDEEYFWDNIKDCIIVFDPKYIDFDYLNKIISFLEYDCIYYQLDTVQYENQDSDKKYLENIGKIIKSSIKPILIQDSYYLDKEDAYIKAKLNQISGDREFKSNNQYFKCFDQIFDELDTIFDKNSETFDTLLDKALKNVYIVSKLCNFEILTNQKFLPKYIMTKEEEKEYQTNENMFDCLIEKGLKEKNKNNKEYLERVEIEKETIDLGKLRDYFLINWEQTKWCKEQDIYTGLSRGSAAGSVISYSMDITKIDPIEYDLIFERFLTKERASHAIPDIDIDHDQIRRDEVKRHLIDKYGKDQCCSVGTFGTLQLKAAIKDLCRIYNVDFETSNTVTKLIPKESTSWQDFMKLSIEYKRIKSFIKEYPELVNDLQLVLGGNKSKSVHASAFIITPKDKTIFEWFPVRKENKDGEDILVSEWSGEDLEKAGFLKQDVLGLLQLTKFKQIVDLIKSQTGENINIYDISLNDKKVFKSICNGETKDIFQFGSRGLAEYILEVQPENINDLIVSVALYRPGAMESGFHKDFINIKRGNKEPEYVRGWEDITKDTSGLLVYQEQTMKIFQKIGGFNLELTDKIRKALGKKKPEILEKYKIDFIEGGIKNGYTKKELSEQWDYIEKTSGYQFNLSHAVAYAITGYISSWFKVNYPIYFWTTAFSQISTQDKDEEIPTYISEISRSENINMLSPSINKSGDGFTPDFTNNSIYWSLNSVKQCGDKAVEQIVEDKQKNGDYFSFSEFLERNMFKGSKTSKSVVEHLILCGAFDEIEKIRNPKDRYELIETYRKKSKTKIDKEKDMFMANQDMLQYNWWWSLQQKRLCGFALFDLETICENYLDSNSKYMDAISIQDKESEKKYITTGGYINDIVLRTSKKGEYADIILDNNFEFITVKIWQDAWEVVRDIVADKKKSLLLLSGRVGYDKYKKQNIISLSEDSDILVLD